MSNIETRAMTTADYLISTRDLRITPTPWTRSCALGVHDCDDAVLSGDEKTEDLHGYSRWLTGHDLPLTPYHIGFAYRANDILIRTERMKEVIANLNGGKR
jgi:hypothetical protein